MPTLRIMSFNMRYPCPADGANAFPHRKGRILATLNGTAPDIIGFQEITPEMRDFLVESLPGYYTVGGGRDADYGGEASLIAFKKNVFALLACDTIMLSSTPSVFGSRYEGSDQSFCPRVYTRVLLKHREIAEPFYVYNVHTDHVGSMARMLASVQLLQDITSQGRRFFLTGDFNAPPTAPEIAMLTACRTRAIADATGGLGPTFHGFGQCPCPEKIDYIFTDSDTRVTAAVRIEDTPAEGEPYISDHNPIYIDTEL